MKYAAYIGKVQKLAAEHAADVKTRINESRESVKEETISNVSFLLFLLRSGLYDRIIGDAKYVAELLAIPQSFVKQNKSNSIEKIFNEWKMENKIALNGGKK